MANLEKMTNGQLMKEYERRAAATDKQLRARITRRKNQIMERPEWKERFKALFRARKTLQEIADIVWREARDELMAENERLVDEIGRRNIA